MYAARANPYQPKITNSNKELQEMSYWAREFGGLSRIAWHAGKFTTYMFYILHVIVVGEQRIQMTKTKNYNDIILDILFLKHNLRIQYLFFFSFWFPIPRD